ncbi:MAG: S1C family serine protease [Verrucomicrobiota bacterium]|nr:S1C family serine protease [Verrucomicrobiota bacterium]
MSPVLLSKKPYSPLQVIVFALAAFAQPCAAQKSVFEQVGQEVTSVFEKTKSSIVKVKSTTVKGVTDLNAVPDQSIREASGFYIDANGLLVTVAGITKGSEKIWVEYANQKTEATLVGVDHRSGIALLRINGKSPSLELGTSDKLSVGAAVIAVGFSYNLPSSPSFGFVSGFDSQYKNSFFVTTHIRANVQISPGQAGGPLLSPDGKVVGMLVAGLEEGRIAYSLPVNAIKKIRDDMLANNGNAQHAWVGIGVVEETKPTPSVRIDKIYSGTPAEKSELHEGDVLIKIGNQDIRTPVDVVDASFYAKVGEPLKITVLRDGKPMDISMTLIPRPPTTPLIEKVPYNVKDVEATPASSTNQAR